MNERIQGLGISPGLVIGKLILRKPAKLLVRQGDGVDQENEKLKQALKEVTEHYERRLARAHSEEELEILQAHQMMVEDPEFRADIEAAIKEGESAAFAVKHVAEDMASMLEALDDEYFRERSQDVRDIAGQLIRSLQGERAEENLKDCILWTEELLASEVSSLKDAGLLGVVTLRGGKTAHSAILAKSFALPYITGVALEKISHAQDSQVILDADLGTLLLHAEQEQIQKTEEKIRERAEEEILLQELTFQKSQSSEGKFRQVSGNIAGPEDIAALLQAGAEGVALYRTEFLFLKEDTLPDEEEQYRVYHEVFTLLEGRPITIRTLDIGGDKASSAFTIPTEDNPFLGLRGIRLSLRYPDVLRTQLKAILRAAPGHDVKIMFPMVTRREDLLSAKKILAEAMEELRREGKTFLEAPAIGIMVEVPSVALSLHSFAGDIDFISIGTNDLIQYTMAADRMNQEIQDYYEGYHPGLLRLIDLCVREAHKHGMEVAMCGDLAGEERLTALWNAIGIEDYGVVNAKITRVRKGLLNSSALNRSLVDEVLACRDAQEVLEKLS